MSQKPKTVELGVKKWLGISNGVVGIVLGIVIVIGFIMQLGLATLAVAVFAFAGLSLLAIHKHKLMQEKTSLDAAFEKVFSLWFYDFAAMWAVLSVGYATYGFLQTGVNPLMLLVFELGRGLFLSFITYIVSGVLVYLAMKLTRI